MALEELVSVSEAARRLGGISKWTVHAWLSQGKLRRTKVGGRTMIRESELQKGHRRRWEIASPAPWLGAFMGNVLRDQCRFFSIPQEFVESGCLLEVSPSGCKLYTVLYYLAQKHSAVRLEFSNAQLRAFTGLDTKSIQSARVQLSDLRLITTQKGALGV